MKKTHSVLALSLLTGSGLAAIGCGDDDTKQTTPVNQAGSSGSGGSGGAGGSATAGSSATAGKSGSPSAGSGGAGASGAGAGGADAGGSGGIAGAAGDSGGSGGLSGSSFGGFGGAGLGGGGVGGVSGTAGSGTGGTAAGSGGMGGTCDVPALEVFQRSDTEASWDDNDFSSAVLNEAGACPRTVDVTWPHEEGWEGGDPSEANRERTHFTIDSYYSSDLTGKQINLTISLTADARGPAATAGSYTVRIVSVSTFDRVITSNAHADGEGGEGAGEGGADGGAGADGNAGTGGVGGIGGVSGAGGSTAGSGAGGATAGSGGATAGSGGDTAGGGAGGTPPTTETGYSEATSVGRGFLTRVGDTASFSFPLPAKTEAEDSYNPARVIKINFRVQNEFEAAEGGAAAPVYDYLTSQFAITNFSISDAQ